VPEQVVVVAIFLGLVGIVAVVGVWLGMLLAPRLGRLTEPPDEVDGGDDD
jgi:hypothetical protein